MIGQDFQFAGNVRHITHRIGDGKGNPFQGPLKICCVKRNVFAVLARDKAIFIRNLRGYSEHIYYPISMVDSVMKRRSVRELKCTLSDQITEVNSAEAESAFAAQDDDEEHDENETSLSSTSFSFIDMQPTDICIISGQNALAITDARFYVHILDLDARNVVKVFGKGGFGPGDFVSPTSICTALIHTKTMNDFNAPDLFYFVGDSLSSQKVKVFTSDYTHFAQVGGLGPAPGQFRDISSLSCFNPNLPSEAGLSSTEEERIAVRTTSTSTSIATREVRAVEQDSVLPDWYRGVQSLDGLETMLYEESFAGNFLMARRKAIVYTDSANLVDTEDTSAEDTTSISGDSALPGQDLTQAQIQMQREGNSAQDKDRDSWDKVLPADVEYAHLEDPNAERIYDLLYITQSKRLEHMVIKENKNADMELGFFVSNSVSPTRQTFSCIYDLIRAQKALKLTFGGDKRKYIYVAVCDQGNYRVQVFRFFWTESFMFRPELQLAHVVGGVKKRYVELFDPVSVQYSPTGNLLCMYSYTICSSFLFVKVPRAIDLEPGVGFVPRIATRSFFYSCK